MTEPLANPDDPLARIAELEADLAALNFVISTLIDLLQETDAADPCKLAQDLRTIGSNESVTDRTWYHLDQWIQEMEFAYCGQPDADGLYSRTKSPLTKE